MKAATITSLVVVATGLIGNVAGPAAAAYEISQTTDLAVNEPATLPAELKLSTVALVSSRAETNAAELTTTAANYTRKRRLRIKSPARVKKHHRPRTPSSMTTGTNNGTHAEAPLDCSIESHPDCPPPKPSNGGSRSGNVETEWKIEEGEK